MTLGALDAYRSRGVLFPFDALGPAEIARARAHFDALLAGRPALTPPERHNAHLTRRWVAEVASHPAVVDAVAGVLGDDVLLWRSVFFVKPAGDPGYVAWHQDAAYWGLDGDAVTTAWIALTDSDTSNGCLRVVPGTHQGPLRRHAAAFDGANLLLRGQSIDARDVGDAAVDVTLAAGQFSLHHVAIVHGSAPNTSGRMRAGLAVRFVAPHVVPRRRDAAVLVRGTDRHGHFDLTPLPRFDGDAAPAAAHAASLRAYSRDLLTEGPLLGRLRTLARLVFRRGTWAAARHLVRRT